MKFNEAWLREWVDPPVDSETLAEQLTMAGLEVEALEQIVPTFTGVVVAKIEEIRPHNAQGKALTLCRVDFGQPAPVAVVCGAENAQVGRFYAYAPVGAQLPGGRTITAREVRGVRSEGMLCAPAELGLSEEADELLECSDTSELQPGLALAEFLRLDDQVLDLALTPNRGDCLSIRGLARELAVINGMEVSRPETTRCEVGIEARRRVTLAAPAACPRYAGRIIQGLDIRRPAPSWLRERLRRAGLKSINAVVDISNFVMLELGQPTHAFDNDRLNGDISVRYARAGESIILLDGQEYALSEATGEKISGEADGKPPDEILVIADEKSAVAMAGVMGGLASAVSAATRNIFLESAFFTPRALAAHPRQAALQTDAAYRYERGVDWQLQRAALERVSALILASCGGQAGPVVEACADEHLPAARPIRLEYAEITRLLGKPIAQEEIRSTLQGLGLDITPEKEALLAQSPSHRFDLSIPADLIEEIARIHGYQAIPAVPARAQLGMRQQSEDRVAVADYKRLLAARGYHEAITYSFVDRSRQAQLLDRDDAIALLNPISTDMGVMRQSLWPGLLQTLGYNLKRQQYQLRLFEYGLVFSQDEGGLAQTPMLAGLIYRKSFIKQWDREDSYFDFFDIKADVEALLGLQDNRLIPEYERTEDAALHPGRSAAIMLDKQRVGRLGAAHPAILEDLGLPAAVYLFELEYQKISAKRALKFRKISKFPSIRRDISIVVDEEISAASLVNCVKSCAPALLQNLELFDLYQGEGIDIKQKSLTLALTFQAASSTLRDERIEEIMGRVLGRLRAEFGATLRE